MPIEIYSSIARFSLRLPGFLVTPGLKFSCLPTFSTCIAVMP